MAQFVEAIFSHGVLKPLDPLELPEDQRVRLIVEPIADGNGKDRKAALERLIARLRRSSFSHGGPYPSRDELHERHDHV